MMHQDERPLDLSTPDDLTIPAFLKRDSNNESEFTKMNPIIPTRGIARASDEAAAAPEPEANAPKAEKPAKEPKAKKAKKAKSDKPAKTATNGHSKPKAEAKGTTKAKARAASAATPKATKGKAKAPAAQRQRDLTKLDAYGFRLGTIKAKAAAMYAKGKGATLADVKAALGSVQFNLLTEVKERGFTVEEADVKGPTGRIVTRYKIVAKE